MPLQILREEFGVAPRFVRHVIAPRGLFRSPWDRPCSRPSSAPPYPMPFVRYLLHDGREVSQDDSHQFNPNFLTHPSQSSENDGLASSSDVPADSSPLQFQLPYFIAFGSSTVAPGGGAEVLPYSQVQPTGDPSPDWLSRSLSPFSPHDP